MFLGYKHDETILDSPRTLVISIILILAFTPNIPVKAFIGLIDAPTYTELAEQADLILIGKVSDIQIGEKSTLTTFRVSEYIKQKNTSPVFTLILAGGTKQVTSPASPSFYQDEEYLLFLMQEDFVNSRNGNKSYYVLFDHYGKPLLEDVDNDSLDNFREAYGSTVIKVYPEWVYLMIAIFPMCVSILLLIITRRTRSKSL